MLVRYALGGTHYALVHWTHAHQNRLVLGRSPAAVMAVVRGPKFIRYAFPEVKRFERIEIVQPSPEFQLRVRLLRESNERRAFTTSVLERANRYRELSGEFPPGFSRCRHYVNGGDPESEDPEHGLCSTCYYGTVARRTTVRALYARELKKPFDSNDWWRWLPHPGQVPSRAPYADPALPLYAAEPWFGPHGDGIGTGLANPAATNDTVLFYYQRPEPLPAELAEAANVVDDARAAAVRWRAKHRSDPERLHALRTASEWALECESVALTHDAALLAARADLAQFRATLARWRAACVGYRRIARIYAHASRLNADRIGDDR